MACGPSGNHQPADVSEAADRLKHWQDAERAARLHDEKSITAVEDEKI
jgi:hypothetical protein